MTLIAAEIRSYFSRQFRFYVCSMSWRRESYRRLLTPTRGMNSEQQPNQYSHANLFRSVSETLVAQRVSRDPLRLKNTVSSSVCPLEKARGNHCESDFSSLVYHGERQADYMILIISDGFLASMRRALILSQCCNSLKRSFNIYKLYFNIWKFIRVRFKKYKPCVLNIILVIRT